MSRPFGVDGGNVISNAVDMRPERIIRDIRRGANRMVDLLAEFPVTRMTDEEMAAEARRWDNREASPHDWQDGPKLRLRLVVLLSPAVCGEESPE